ncbi:hypothetical protein C8F01DRAFT_46518 [Mycena amicta]|nr:hypothetical protein C8F01DRAFT_46518 [Mycena amicta]
MLFAGGLRNWLGGMTPTPPLGVDHQTLQWYPACGRRYHALCEWPEELVRWSGTPLGESTPPTVALDVTNFTEIMSKPHRTVLRRLHPNPAATVLAGVQRAKHGPRPSSSNRQHKPRHSVLVANDHPVKNDQKPRQDHLQTTPHCARHQLGDIDNAIPLANTATALSARLPPFKPARTSSRRPQCSSNTRVATHFTSLLCCRRVTSW